MPSHSLVLWCLPLLALANGCSSSEASGPPYQPSTGGVPGGQPTAQPSGVPTGAPTGVPTGAPTGVPTGAPTGQPTAQPTGSPTGQPTSVPTGMPTGVPTTTPPDDPNTTFTISSSTFDLAPGGETYKCQNFKNPLDKDVAIISTESTMVKGSHHMFVFHETAFNQNTNAVATCSGVEFHDYLHVAQTPHEIITYPAGVGRILKKGEGLRILAHYLNTTSDPIAGQITIKFRFVETNQVQFLAAQMFLNNGGLFVPVGKSTQSRTFNVPYDIKMLYAVSHMHSRGTRFQARTNTGQVIYDGADWDEPKENVFTPPMDVKAGSTITWSCDYENGTGRTLTFGESADVNEMCILNALFYPPTAGQHQGQALDTNF